MGGTVCLDVHGHIAVVNDRGIVFSGEAFRFKADIRVGMGACIAAQTANGVTTVFALDSHISGAVGDGVHHFQTATNAAQTHRLVAGGFHGAGCCAVVDAAAKAAAEKGIHVNIVGMGDPKGSPIPIQGSNNYMKDKDGNVVITKLNEQMGQEIAAAGNGMYVRADNTNSALKALQKEIEKMNKTELDSKVYSEYDEQFQIFAWIALFLLIADFMTLDRKNRIFRKVKLFS